MKIKNLDKALHLNLKKLKKGVYTVYKEPLVVYKKLNQYRVLKCIIPIGATIVFPYGYTPFNNRHKCRTNKLIPIEFVTGGGKKAKDQSPCRSWRRFGVQHIYALNELYEPHKRLNENTNDCCRSGIHFFTKLNEAVSWG